MPDVAVCGVVSLFIQTILLVSGTLSLSGLKLGFPWTFAQGKMVMEVVPGKSAAAGTDAPPAWLAACVAAI